MARRLQGTIRQRGEKWQVTISTGRGADGRYHRQSYTCATEDEAHDKLLELNQAKRRGELIAERPDSLGEFLNDWLAGVIRPNRAARTHETYKMVIDRHLAGSPLSTAKVDRLRPQDVQAYYGELLKRGVSADMVRRVHRVLHAALAQAVAWGYVSRNPATGLKLPRHQPREYRVLTAAETKKLIDAFHAADPKKQQARASLWAPAAVMVSTGMRPEELLALRWSDIDFEAGTVTVCRALEEIGRVRSLKETKTKGSRRTVPLHADTVAVLKEHRRRQNELRLSLSRHTPWEDNDLVFPDTTPTTLTDPSGELVKFPAGRLRSKKAMGRLFVREARALGFEYLRFYDLRHTHITHLLHAGVPVKDVSARVGHASAAMTLGRYAHLLPGSQERAVEALDGLIGERQRAGKGSGKGLQQRRERK